MIQETKESGVAAARLHATSSDEDEHPSDGVTLWDPHGCFVVNASCFKSSCGIKAMEVSVFAASMIHATPSQ